MSLGRKGKAIFTFAFYEFIFTVNVYLFDMGRVKAYEIFCAILGKKNELIVIEFAKCGMGLAHHPKTFVYGS